MHRRETADPPPAPRDWVYPGEREVPEELLVDLDGQPGRGRKHRPKH